MASGKVLHLVAMVMLLQILQVFSETEWKNGHKDLSDAMPYYIVEELAADTPIGNVAIDFKLTEKYNKTVLQLLRFHFLRQVDATSQPVTLFGLDETTGILKTTEKIDRDVICSQEPTCFVYLDISVQPSEYFQVIKIKVDILDVNDHAPVFPESEVQKKVPESTLPGTTLTLSTASDPDSKAFSIQSYELLSSAGKFELKIVADDNGKENLILEVREKLDREEADFYQFQILAHDGGTPARTGSVLVNIEVEDANDNDPKFENATYEVFVLENMEVGTTIGRVHARDLDIGANGQISYGFTSRTEREFGRSFGVVNDTGAIYMKESLDFEAGSTYLLVVNAHDRGPNSKPAHATVIIRVEDANDNTPEITVSTRTTTGVAQVSEDAEIGTFVADISVTDQDGGDNGRVECSMESDHFQLRKLYSTQYKIITLEKISRETQPQYELTVDCHDNGRIQKSVMANIRVEIVDANDHAPVFSLQTYTATLPENNFIGDVLVKVNATDSDEGINGEVRFRMHPDVSALFRVHPIKGVVTANAVFDHEKIPSMDVKVIAFDLGIQPLSSTATVILTIVDSDDEPPQFSQSGYAFGTFENQPPNTEIGSVTATDHDDPPYNAFKYKFANPSGEDPQTFRIAPDTGKLFTRKVLDREAKAVYYMYVVAYSDDSPSLSSSASVTIYVADKNDNYPFIQWPNPDNNTVYISNLIPNGEQIAAVKATDLDNGDNGKLTYFFTVGNHEKIFYIDPGTGIISLEGDLSQVPYEHYQLRIQVKDHGMPEHSVYTDLHIVVNQSLPYMAPLGVIYTNNNTTIIVTLTSASLILIFLLVIAIVLIRRQFQGGHKEKNYTDAENAPETGQTNGLRVESQKMLASRDEAPDGGESGIAMATSINSSPVSMGQLSVTDAACKTAVQFQHPVSRECPASGLERKQDNTCRDSPHVINDNMCNLQAEAQVCGAHMQPDFKTPRYSKCVTRDVGPGEKSSAACEQYCPGATDCKQLSTPEIPHVQYKGTQKIGQANGFSDTESSLSDNSVGSTVSENGNLLSKFKGRFRPGISEV